MGNHKIVNPSQTTGTLQRNKQSTRDHQHITLLELHRGIVYGTWQQQIERLRSIQDTRYKAQGQPEQLKAVEQQISQIKSNLPCYMPAGQFQGNRVKNNLTNYTGIHYIDVDFHDTPEHQWTDAEVNEKLDYLFQHIQDLPWVVEAHRSASGRGAHVFFWLGLTEPDYINHKEQYLRVAQTFAQHYHLEDQVDLACSDIMRITFVSYDPEAYFRPLYEWKPFLNEDKDEDENTPSTDTAADQTLPTQKVSSSRLDALQGSAYTEQKRAVDGWKRRVKFDDLTKHQKQVVEQFLSSHQYKTPGRHYFWPPFLLQVRRRGVKRDNIEPFIQYMTLLLDQAGLAQDDPLNRGDEVQKILDWVYNLPLNDQDIQPIKEQPLLSETVHNYIASLHLRHNLVKSVYEIQKDLRWQPITDEDVHTLQHTLEKQIQKLIASDLFRRVLHSDAVEQVNPLWDFVNNLPEWDGHDYIQDLADTVTVDCPEDKPLWDYYLRKWLVAMLKGWLDEDVVNHEVLVLIGEQGKYKSTWLRKLLPPELKEYVTDWSDKAEINKDDRLMTTQFGLINLDEMDAMSDRQMNQVKSLITATVINERGAYRENTERRIHIASFCGSGNKEEFLTDTTGNRRWLPFRVTHVQEPQTIQYNYPQLYAQIYQLLVSGFQYWLTQEENQQVTERARRFSKVSMEEELIQLLLQPIPAESEYIGAKWMSASEVILELQNNHFMGRTTPEKIGQILSDKGFVQKRTKHGRKYHLLLRQQGQIDEIQRKG